MEEEEKHNKTIASPDQYSHKNNAYFSLPPGHAGVKWKKVKGPVSSMIWQYWPNKAIRLVHG